MVPSTVSYEYAKYFRGTLAGSHLGYHTQSIHDVLCRRLKLHPYKLQLVQKITHKDHDSRKQFALEMPSHIEEDEMYLNSVFLLKEHFMCVEQSTRTVAVYGEVRTCDVTEHEHDSPKVNVRCALLKRRVISPFFFLKNLW
jgi:hypothetical protein